MLSLALDNLCNTKTQRIIYVKIYILRSTIWKCLWLIISKFRFKKNNLTPSVSCFTWNCIFKTTYQFIFSEYTVQLEFVFSLPFLTNEIKPNNQPFDCKNFFLEILTLLTLFIRHTISPCPTGRWQNYKQSDFINSLDKDSNTRKKSKI